MCLMNERGWPLGRRSRANISRNDGLREMADLATLLFVVDVSPERAIHGVVKKMIAKGIKMHNSNKREEGTSKGESGV
jgi:hypothetical protein